MGPFCCHDGCLSRLCLTPHAFLKEPVKQEIHSCRILASAVRQHLDALQSGLHRIAIRQKIHALLQQNLNGCRIGIQIQVRQAFHRLQLLLYVLLQCRNGHDRLTEERRRQKNGGLFYMFFHRLLPHR